MEYLVGLGFGIAATLVMSSTSIFYAQREMRSASDRLKSSIEMQTKLDAKILRQLKRPFESTIPARMAYCKSRGHKAILNAVRVGKKVTKH